ncbi:hypothetical protein HCN44_008252 [Aphidius gifuensis]|uniref:Uncharacterized protein n=1 Tax=Aphidius gifuensis TaxID=684658 RepID=A0A834XLT4_APHGI|nr:hypothetical protein HCN44_008252 [Aphidius gifuensis]
MPTRKLTEAVSHTSVMKKESQGYIDNLKNKNKTELQDLLERQNKLLANTFFIKKLPDKGERIKKFKDKLIEELSERNDIDNAANLLSRLNIAIEGKEKMNELEWTGTIDDNKNNNDIVIVESDDEDKDPIKIIAEVFIFYKIKSNGFSNLKLNNNIIFSQLELVFMKKK